MRALRLSLVGTVILALLSGTALGVVAQDETAAPKQPWTADWLTPTEEGAFGVAGPGLPSCILDRSEREAEYGPSGGKEVRNLRFTCVVVFSDPRLSGTQTTRFSEHCFVAGGCINWGTMEITGTDGSWSGRFNGTEDPSGETNLYIVLEGSGAYEGLTNIRHATGAFWNALTQVGVIYRGDQLPASALPEG